ncbi:MAG: DUF2871 domain-containing protein [Propionibacteriales bacterium]|nr:DUF2871 domain-containing protein [Propionibacteriales bacterium]
MKKIFALTATWTTLGLLGGLAYREITKAADFTGTTQLAVVHTHLLTLGTIIGLILLVLERTFSLSRFRRTFNAGLITWNLGVAITTVMMFVHGTAQVNGTEVSAAIPGIAGLGHMLLTAGFVLFFICLGRSLKTAAPSTPAVVGASVVVADS